MGVPQSNGVLRTKLSDMKIGDYIFCGLKGTYFGVSGADLNTLFRFGTDAAPFSYNENTTDPASLAGGITHDFGFYAIKVDTGLLIADRIVATLVSAQDLNKVGLLTGREFKPADKQTNNFIARSLARSEFLKYISNSDLNGSITKASPNVWHGMVNPGNCTIGAVAVAVYQEINQDRIGGGVITSLFLDGKTYSPVYNAWWPGGPAGSYIQQDYTASIGGYGKGNCYNSNCFRPCFEYVDNAKSTNLYY